MFKFNWNTNTHKLQVLMCQCVERFPHTNVFADLTVKIPSRSAPQPHRHRTPWQEPPLTASPDALLVFRAALCSGFTFSSKPRLSIQLFIGQQLKADRFSSPARSRFQGRRKKKTPTTAGASPVTPQENSFPSTVLTQNNNWHTNTHREESVCTPVQTRPLATAQKHLQFAAQRQTCNFVAQRKIKAFTPTTAAQSFLQQTFHLFYLLFSIFSDYPPPPLISSVCERHKHCCDDELLENKP